MEEKEHDCTRFQILKVASRKSDGWWNADVKCKTTMAAPIVIVQALLSE